MGNGSSSKHVVLANSYGVKPEQIKIINGKMFLQQERSEVKIPSSVLKVFVSGNNFSRDYDEEPVKK
jgi:hypothetical protein